MNDLELHHALYGPAHQQLLREEGTAMEERTTFAPMHRHLLEAHKAVLESEGFVCRVEECMMGKFPVLTLVAVSTKPSREERGCNL